MSDDPTAKLAPAVVRKKVAVEVKPLPPTEAPKTEAKKEAPKTEGETMRQMSPMDYTAARRKAIQVALDKAKAKAAE